MSHPNEPAMENIRPAGPERTLRLTEFSLVVQRLWMAEHQCYKAKSRINRLRLRANIYTLQYIAYYRKRAVILRKGVRLLNSLVQNAQVTDQSMAMARRFYIEYDKAERNVNRCARARTRARERERVVLRQSDSLESRMTVLRRRLHDLFQQASRFTEAETRQLDVFMGLQQAIIDFQRYLY